MPYQNPTLFGVAYASRLFREVDAAQAYEKLRNETGPELDLQYPDNNGHAQAMLNWLNSWGCRIDKKSPGQLFQSLEKWFRQWKLRFPRADIGLLDAEKRDFDVLADAYEALLPIHDLGPTGASKLLFSIRPESAMAWDAAIQSAFQCPASAPMRQIG